MGYFCPLLLFSTLPLIGYQKGGDRVFYQSDVKEASGMLNIHFGLALIDTLDLIEEAFITEYYFSFRYN